MPARLIHRFGSSDRRFRGATPALIGDIRSGEAVLFGLAGHRAQAQAIRDASWFAPIEEATVGRCDLGDADAECGLVCAAIRRRAGRPFLLGGTIGDAVTLARSSEAAAVVLLSPRLDLPVSGFDERLLFAIGSHDLLPASSVQAWREAGGMIEAVTDEAPLEARLASIAPRQGTDRRAVVILDASVVDTGYAAGARSLNVGGLTPLELLAAVKLIVARFDVEGLAVTGLEPHRDPRGHSELVVAEALDIAGDRIGAGSPA